MTNSIPVQDCRLVAVAWPVAWTDPGLVTVTRNNGHWTQTRGAGDT